MNFSSRSICARCKTIPYEKGTETVSACDGKWMQISIATWKFTPRRQLR